MRRKLPLLAAILLGTLAGVQIGLAQPAHAAADPKPTLAPLMRRVMPAVVNIAVDSTVTLQRNSLFDDPFFRQFFGTPDQQGPNEVPQHSVGSGVIIDAENGYVLTNHHVIDNADEIAVTLSDQRQVKAKLIGSDPGTDVALLQIEAPGLAEIEFGDSDQLEVGDYVVAIGNPFGLGQTVTSGIVSALGRAGLSADGYEDFIQTDASINPGNSGGALIDLDGCLVGINSAIVSPAGGNVGIGFAVPSNMARSVMDQILQYGEVRRGRLGIYLQDLTPDLASALDLNVDDGALVTEVETGSAAEQAGIMAGDVLTAIDGRNVHDATDLRNRVGLIRVGEAVAIDGLRDGRTIEFHARIGEPALADQPTPGGRLDKLDGVQFANLPPNHPQRGKVSGVLVTQVIQDSPAWRAGLRADDIVLAVNRKPVADVDQLRRALADAGSTFALNVLRGAARIYIVVR